MNASLRAKPDRKVATKPLLPARRREPAAVRAPGRPQAFVSRGEWMSRTALNFIVDVALLVLFCLLLWISAVLRFVFPPGTQAAGWSLWGLDYDTWCGLQFNTLCAMALAVLLHVMLHWTWVCGVITSRVSKWRGMAIRLDDGARTIYGVGTLIVILNVLGILLAAAALSVTAG